MKRYFYLLLLLLSVHISGFAQSDSISLNSLIEKAVKANNDHPVEKAYLHFDKPYYAVGDTIWFKAYVTMDIHQPSEISKVLNVEIINPRDSVLESLKLPVSNGVAVGNFALTGVNYRQGNYRIRSYTNWMLNFTSSYMFDKTFAVGSALNKDINTQVSYSGNVNDKDAKLNARILYRNIDGTVLADRKVDWRIEKNGDIVSKGKGTTDGKGYLNVSIAPGSKADDISASALITNIELADKKVASTAYTLKNVFNNNDFQFFAEGGTLVSDVQNVIAFKAIKGNGLGIEVKGSVTDPQGKEVAAFSSQHLGMGKFTFTPQNNTIYKATVEFADGSKATYNLPRVTGNGVSLALNNAAPSALVLQINSSPTFFERNKNRSFYIVIKSGGFVAFAAQTTLSSQTYTASIPKTKFKTGVVQVTLLSTEGDPLSERLAFIDRNDALNIAVSTDKPAYTARQRVGLKLAAKMEDKPVEGNFSVAVVDETKTPFNENAETTILSHLLLTSDITGYVEQPNYYFIHPDLKKADDLDVLMMTQGFRQFTFDDIITGKIPKISLAAEQGIDLAGNLRKLNGLPVFKGAVRIIIPDKNFSAETTTDADGNFIFRNMVFTDSSKVTISARNNPDSRNMKITMNSGFYPVITKSLNAPDEMVNIDSTLNGYVKNSERQYQFNRVLKEVVIKSAPVKKISHVDYTALTGLSSIADHEVPGTVFKGCNNFLNCLQTALLGVTYRDNNFYITRDYNQGNKQPIQFFVKGLQVDVGYLNSIDAAQVESVETFFSDGFTSINKMNNTNGIVSINMKQAPKGTKVSASDLKELFPDQNVIAFTPKGYAKVRQFYSPKYDVTKPPQSADLRTTIYWNPVVITDKLGNATLQFNNAESHGTYKAVVEGIDKDGNIGRTVYRYTIK